MDDDFTNGYSNTSTSSNNSKSKLSAPFPKRNSADAFDLCPARYKIDGHFAYPKDNANRGMPDWLSPEAPLLPRMLQKAGYATGHFGKWHLANNMIPDSPLPSDYGYDAYGAFNCAGEQMPVHEDAKNASDFIV